MCGRGGGSDVGGSYVRGGSKDRGGSDGVMVAVVAEVMDAVAAI